MNKELFLKHLKDNEKKSENTIEAYGRDLNSFEKFICRFDKERQLTDITETDVISYVMELRQAGRTNSTISRKLSTLRSFYKYLFNLGQIANNPADDVKVPKDKKKDVEYLSEEEMDRLLSLPDDTPKGQRDKAMLEVLYATGIRVSELIELDLVDINLVMGFVTCDGSHGKARIVPIGEPAKKAVRNYIKDGRKVFSEEGETGKAENGRLFVNYMGNPMTRQGFWKILKEYGSKMKMKGKISPQVIRNSFAVHMLQHGADIKTLQELMGTEDLQALEAYMIARNIRIKDVYNNTHPRA